MRPSRQTHREPRLPYQGRVRVLLDFAPWRLALSLDGVNLSATGALAQLRTRDATKDPMDVESLLAEGDEYLLQIEHAAEHLPSPVVKARLVRRQPLPTGLAVAFAFAETGGELQGLVQELAR